MGAKMTKNFGLISLYSKHGNYSEIQAWNQDFGMACRCRRLRTPSLQMRAIIKSQKHFRPRYNVMKLSLWALGIESRTTNRDMQLGLLVIQLYCSAVHSSSDLPPV